MIQNLRNIARGPKSLRMAFTALWVLGFLAAPMAYRFGYLAGMTFQGAMWLALFITWVPLDKDPWPLGARLFLWAAGVASLAMFVRPEGGALWFVGFVVFVTVAIVGRRGK